MRGRLPPSAGFEQRPLPVRSASARSNLSIDPFRWPACHAAAVRSVDLSLAGLPPGGVRGEWSRLESASRMSSIETGALAPGMARKAGHDVTAGGVGRPACEDRSLFGVGECCVGENI